MDAGNGQDAEHTPAQRAAAQRIAAMREETVHLVESLAHLWDDVVDAAALVAHDDEHDPEGATLAFERAQLRDALAQARTDLDDLDHAARRVDTGDYWSCERCGGPIAPARLAARPAATTCITCADMTPR